MWHTTLHLFLIKESLFEIVNVIAMPRTWMNTKEIFIHCYLKQMLPFTTLAEQNAVAIAWLGGGTIEIKD